MGSAFLEGYKGIYRLDVQSISHRLRAEMERIPEPIKVYHALSFGVSFEIGIHELLLLVRHTFVEHLQVFVVDTRFSYRRRILSVRNPMPVARMVVK